MMMIRSTLKNNGIIVGAIRGINNVSRRLIVNIGYTANAFKASSIAIKSYRNTAVHNEFRRCLSVITTSPEAKFYDYEDVKSIASKEELNPKVVLVDVREPSEFAEGHIPHAVNIPYKSLPGALDLSPEEFEENFGFEKPGQDKELIFYCLGGVRSTAAEELASSFGYKKRGNYLGSWEDWVAHEQPSAAAAAPTASDTTKQDSAKL